jgi:hypothetical protein
MPMTVGAGGVEKILKVELDYEEKRAFDNSVKAVKTLVEVVKKQQADKATGNVVGTSAALPRRGPAPRGIGRSACKNRRDQPSINIPACQVKALSKTLRERKS